MPKGDVTTQQIRTVTRSPYRHFVSGSGAVAVQADGLLVKFSLRRLVALEVSMADFHETSAPKAHSTIDTAGWLFVAFVVAITAVAAMLAYNGSDTLAAKTASQVVGPHG